MLKKPFDPKQHDFVFSNSEIEREARRRDRLELAEIGQKFGWDVDRFRSHTHGMEDILAA